ncbi:band 4.1-like protein 3 [Watersipora subatra]|uniref:band 4.1-like protein 3 n=1 Tax=Watersipora subatra TaxID=2589382 RepID=UPI00355B3EDD
MVKCLVHLLDGDKFETQLQKGAIGKELFDAVKEKLTLKEEGDYFSMSYIEPKSQHRRWMDMEKRIDKQMEGSQAQVHEFSFELKFYPPVPENLNEDLTRYFIVLQIRKDLWTGLLPSSFYTLAMLGSYTVQSELGDYDRNEHHGIEYLRPYSFAPKSTEELLSRIADLHHSHRGMTPEEADLYFLQNAKRMAMYGMELHEVKDNKGRKVSLGMSASGLYLYEGRLRMDKYKWHRMLKMSYKGDHLLIKVRPAEYEKSEKVHMFKLPNKKEAKRLWRIAVEHHQFFRLKQPEPVDSNTFGTFGSRRWRMSGRTATEIKNTGTPKRDDYSKPGIFLSPDNYQGSMEGRSGTLPYSQGSRGMDPTMINPYGTYAGHRSERSVQELEEHGNFSYDDHLNDSTMTRGPVSTRLGMAGVPTDTRYQSANDLEAGDYNPETGQMVGHNTTLNRNGGMTPSEYESYSDLVKPEHTSHVATPQYPPGVGELPLPCFSNQSAGVTPNGALDFAYPLATVDRSEKSVKERETKLKNPRMTVDTTASIDDQLLLDAILAVTGLDPRLNVDKVLIKTEEQP